MKREEDNTNMLRKRKMFAFFYKKRSLFFEKFFQFLSQKERRRTAFVPRKAGKTRENGRSLSAPDPFPFRPLSSTGGRHPSFSFSFSFSFLFSVSVFLSVSYSEFIFFSVSFFALFPRAFPEAPAPGGNGRILMAEEQGTNLQKERGTNLKKQWNFSSGCDKIDRHRPARRGLRRRCHVIHLFRI